MGEKASMSTSDHDNDSENDRELDLRKNQTPHEVSAKPTIKKIGLA
jgi:hypothetical protein